jgi:uncharacterized membrane protein YkvA (DUF1232 family)
MNSSAFKKYDTNFSTEGFWATVQKYAKNLGRETLHKAFCLWLVIRESDAPAWAKGVAVGALGWLISPVDPIPDITPVIGLSDDATAIAAAIAVLAAYINDEIKRKAEAMLPDWMRD